MRCGCDSVNRRQFYFSLLIAIRHPIWWWGRLADCAAAPLKHANAPRREGGSSKQCRVTFAKTTNWSGHDQYKRNLISGNGYKNTAYNLKLKTVSAIYWRLTVASKDSFEQVATTFIESPKRMPNVQFCCFVRSRLEPFSFPTSQFQVQVFAMLQVLIL